METKTPLAERLPVTTSPVCPLLTDPTPGLTTGSRIRKVQRQMLAGSATGSMPAGSPTRQETFLCKNTVLRTYTRFGVWQRKQIIRFTDEKKKKRFFFFEKLLVFLKKAFGK